MIVLVQTHIISWPPDATIVGDRMQKHFGALPVVLASPDPAGFWKYIGDPVLVEYLEAMDPAQYQWKLAKLPD